MAPYIGLGLTFVTTVFLAAWYLRGLIADVKTSVLEGTAESAAATAATNQNVAILRTEHVALKERVERIETKVNK